jgi:hypothetical protein
MSYKKEKLGANNLWDLLFYNITTIGGSDA